MIISHSTCGPMGRTKKAITFGLILFCILGQGCSDSNVDLLKFTTSSERAEELFRIGLDLYERLREMEARLYFKEAIALDSNFALVYLYLAWTESTRDERLALLDQAAGLLDFVSDGERLIISSSIARESGNHIQEREDLQQLVSLYPGDARAFNLLGNQYLHTEDFELAIAAYKKAIAVDPKFSQAYNGLGYAYNRSGEHAKAEQTFLRYIELIPNDPNPYDSYAELLLCTGRFSEATENYQKALRKNPYFFMAYEGLASAYNYLGRYDEARGRLQEMYDRARTPVQQRAAHFALAASYADEGNCDSALAQIKQSYALAEQALDLPGMAAELNNMGHILLGCGKSDKARGKYKQAAELVAESSLAAIIKEAARRNFLYHSARVAIQQKDLTAARKYAEQYRQLVAELDNPVWLQLIHELAGTIALEAGEYQAALHELQQANLRDPHNLLRLKQTCEKLGDPQRAEDLAQQFAAFYADNSLSHALIRGQAQRNLAARDAD